MAQVIVLDLNGLLVDRVRKGQTETIFVRPDAKKFIKDLCKKDLFVVIWSSATRKNINKILSKIFGKDPAKKCIYLILDQSDCITIETDEPKPLFLKSEEYLKRIIPFEVDILFVDDTEEKMVLNSNSIITNTWSRNGYNSESLKDILITIEDWHNAQLLNELNLN